MTEEQRRYRAAVDRLFVELYGVTLSDAGFDRDYPDQFLADGWPPEQTVEWIGDKYGLLRRGEW